MNSPISPLLPSSAHSHFLPRSPNSSRSPWSALLSPTPNRPRFNPTALASLIRNRANNQPPSPHSPIPHAHPSSGEDLNNYVWDVDGSASAAARRATDLELYQIARLYLPPPSSRPRPPPATSSHCHGRAHCTSPDPALSSAGPLSSSSAGAFKTSLNRLLRKRTVAHLKQSSQSSCGTSCPSDHSADADAADPDSDLELIDLAQDSDDEDQAGDQTHHYTRPPPAVPNSHNLLAVPSTPVFQTPSDGCFPNVPTFQHHVHASDDEDRFRLERIPVRSSSILR